MTGLSNAYTGSGGVPSNNITGTGTAGEVAFFTATYVIDSDSTFLWDDTNKNLGLGAAPASVAILDLTSTTKGFRPPRMTTVQRDAITAVAGLIIFNTTTGVPNFYDGAAWQATGAGTVTGSGASGRVAFWSGASALSSDSLFFWDDTNNRLGIGTGTPSFDIDVQNGSANAIMRLGRAAGFASVAMFSTGTTNKWSIGIQGVGVTGNADDLIFYDEVAGAFKVVFKTSTGRVGIGVAAPSYLLQVEGDAQVTNRLHSPSQSVASANDVTLPATNSIRVTGTTRIDRLASANWVNGDIITLSFADNVTVSHFVAAGGGFASILLAGSVNMSTIANTTLSLRFDGTNWAEVARGVI